MRWHSVVRTSKTISTHVAQALLGTVALAAVISVASASRATIPNPNMRLTSSSYGYVMAGAGGAAYNFGTANYGSTYTDGLTGLSGAHPLNAPVVGIATDPAGGYWMAAKDGGVFNFGAATFHGSTYTYGITGLTGSRPLNAPIVGMAATPHGNGYWLVAADGGIFNFGSAKFYGSTYTLGVTGLTGSHPLNAPIVGMAAAPDGKGYWLVAADGGIFNFGSAGFHGNPYTYGITGLSGPHPLNAPIVGMAPTANGQGYWLVAKDGGMFNFANATFHGSTYTYGITGLTGSRPLNAPIVGMASTPGGNGYWMVGADGGVFNFGSATYLGSEGGQSIPAPVVGIGGMATQPAITTTSLPTGASNEAYKSTLNATGGAGSYNWSATGLPSGLSMSTSGVISGTPTVSGTTTVSIAITDSGGASSTTSLTLVINPPLSITTTSLPSATSNQAYSTTLSATGGAGSYNWSATGLPSGLSMSTSGVISGTPTVSGTTTVSIAITDSGGASSTTSLTLVINPPLSITTTSLPSATSNQAYSTTLSATGGAGSYNWSATGLPSGLSMSTSGVISGTPGNANTASVVVTVSDSSAQSTTVTLSLTTDPQLLTVGSGNWSGYDVQNGAFDGVSTTFNVASLTSPQPSVCSNNPNGTTATTGTLSQTCAMGEWAGIGGGDVSGSDSIIQAGIGEIPIVGTDTFYIYAWYELYPANPIPINMTVNPGDNITVSINETTATSGSWDIQINDTSNGESFSTQQSYSGATNTAEWIVEAPGQTTLSPYSPVTFTNPSYNLAPSGGIDALVQCDMVQNGSIVSIPSTITSTGTFTVSYQ
ncbi:MAG: putative Ig domain-containing protein [Ferrimicrobium sp.]